MVVCIAHRVAETNRAKLPYKLAQCWDTCWESKTSLISIAGHRRSERGRSKAQCPFAILGLSEDLTPRSCCRPIDSNLHTSQLSPGCFSKSLVHLHGRAWPGKKDENKSSVSVCYSSLPPRGSEIGRIVARDSGTTEQRHPARFHVFNDASA